MKRIKTSIQCFTVADRRSLVGEREQRQSSTLRKGLGEATVRETLLKTWCKIMIRKAPEQTGPLHMAPRGKK